MSRVKPSQEEEHPAGREPGIWAGLERGPGFPLCVRLWLHTQKKSVSEQDELTARRHAGRHARHVMSDLFSRSDSCAPPPPPRHITVKALVHHNTWLQPQKTWRTM